MVWTNVGKSGTCLAVGSYSSNRPQYMAIGTGSGAVADTNIALIAEGNRKSFSSVAIDGTNNEITYTADWSSVAMSGLNLKEFGIFDEVSAGSLWDREGMAGVNFDGTNELQIELKITHI